MYQYVALERLESIYKSCRLVVNLCVHASPSAVQPMAIIIPHERNIRAATDADSRALSFSDLCADPGVRRSILRECNDIGRRAGLRPFELLAAVVLTPEEWTPENGLVTPAMKIQRAKIGKVFEQEIKVCEVLFQTIWSIDFCSRKLTGSKLQSCTIDEGNRYRVFI